MQYLVADADCEFAQKETSNLRIVEANSAIDAVKVYKLRVYAHDSHFHEYVLNKNGFDEKFWIVTEKENAHYEKTGELLATPALFRRRLTTYFEDRPDLAIAYLDHYFSENKNTGLLPYFFPALAEYLLITKNEYANIAAIPIKEISIIRADEV